MSETSETNTTASPDPRCSKPRRGVAIAAGTVFIVAVIFFTGYILGVTPVTAASTTGNTTSTRRW